MRLFTRYKFVVLVMVALSLQAHAFMGLTAIRMGHVTTMFLQLLAGTINIGTYNASGTAARFNYPSGLSIDGSGNIMIADTYNFTILSMTSTGAVTTLAGSHDSIYGASLNGTGSAAQFYLPYAVVWNPVVGAYFVADSGNDVIREVTTAGVVTTFAGQANVTGFANGTGTGATFNFPTSIAVDSSGNMYVTDANNNAIRKITTAGVVTTFAGSGSSGSANGTGTAATFAFPNGIVIDSTSATLYVVDCGNSIIRKVTVPGAVVTTFAGTAGSTSLTNGTGTAARFNFPSGIGIDSSNVLYVADSDNNAIRKITTPGAVVTTLAGSTTAGYADGTGTAASFRGPNATVADSSGNLYVADSLNSTIRKIVISTGVVTTFAGTAGPDAGVNGTGAAAAFSDIQALTVDGSGNLYAADTTNAVIRKITSAGVATTLAGQVGNPGFTNATGTSAQFNSPRGIVYDSVSGNLFVADSTNYVIRKVTTAGVVTTYAGTGGLGSTNSTLTASTFASLAGLAVDSSGNLYVPDTYNCMIRKVTTSAVTTLAGQATCGFANGTGTAAKFNDPLGAVVDSSGNVYVTDTGNYVIRKVTSAGVVTTFAGTQGTPGFVNGTGTAAQFNFMIGIKIDSSGNLYVADAGNHAIRKITSAGVVTTVIGNGAGVTLLDDLPSTIYFPYDMALYSGKLFISLFGGIIYSPAP